MPNYDGLYDIRDGKPEDHKFVLATMLRGLYYGDSWFSQIPKGEFMDNYKTVIASILNSPNNQLKVACLKEDQDTILGYSLMSADFLTVHFVFVKSIWRLKGIARRLVPARPLAVSHLTDLGKTLLSKLPNTVFNPFKIS